jgi:hypothetical protein
MTVRAVSLFPLRHEVGRATKSYGRIVAATDTGEHRFWRPSVIRAVAASNLRLRSFVFKKCPPLSPKGIVGFEGAACDVTKLKAHRDHKYVKRYPP